MAEAVQTLDASDGELLLHTDVAGRAAKLGHRLTVAMKSWQAAVSWSGDQPSAVRLTAEVDSFQVLSAEGGLTPLSGPEKALVRSNALKCLASQRYPQIYFQTTEIISTDDGYRLDGLLDIHGQARQQVVDVRIDDLDGSWRLDCESVVRQTEYGVKPFSMLMGSMKVADDVAVSLTVTVAKGAT